MKKHKVQEELDDENEKRQSFDNNLEQAQYKRSLM